MYCPGCHKKLDTSLTSCDRCGWQIALGQCIPRAEHARIVAEKDAEIAQPWETTMGDGGPAFPHQDSGDTGTRPGMSLRNWFAGQAPVTMGDAARVCGWPPEFNLTQDSDRAVFWAVMAMLRFEYADAMIVARRIKGDDNG